MFGTVLSALAAAGLIRYAAEVLDPATLMTATAIVCAGVVWRLATDA